MAVYIQHPKQSVTWSPGEPQSVRDAYDAQQAQDDDD